jgi:hypothetical protein
MWRFADWLLIEERSLVDLSVLNSYERSFRERLEDLIAICRGFLSLSVLPANSEHSQAVKCLLPGGE